MILSAFNHLFSGRATRRAVPLPQPIPSHKITQWGVSRKGRGSAARSLEHHAPRRVVGESVYLSVCTRVRGYLFTSCLLLFNAVLPRSFNLLSGLVPPTNAPLPRAIASTCYSIQASFSRASTRAATPSHRNSFTRECRVATISFARRCESRLPPEPPANPIHPSLQYSRPQPQARAPPPTNLLRELPGASCRRMFWSASTLPSRPSRSQTSSPSKPRATWLEVAPNRYEDTATLLQCCTATLLHWYTITLLYYYTITPTTRSSANWFKLAPHLYDDTAPRPTPTSLEALGRPCAVRALPLTCESLHGDRARGY